MENNTFKYYLQKYKNGTSQICDGKYITVDENEKDVVFSSDQKGLDWHRLDGPAYILFDSDGMVSTASWYINDDIVTEKITTWAKENSIDLNNLTDVDKALIKLVWADYGK